MASEKTLIILVLALFALAAIVLVVALVVVALVSGVTPTSSGVSETQSRNYWAAASPLSVTGWKYSGTTLYLTLQNTDSQNITLTGVHISGSSVFSANTTFSPGESRTITASMGSTCGGSGSAFELSSISFTYDKGSITGLTQMGDKPIIGKCS